MTAAPADLVTCQLSIVVMANSRMYPLGLTVSLSSSLLVVLVACLASASASVPLVAWGGSGAGERAPAPALGHVTGARLTQLLQERLGNVDEVDETEQEQQLPGDRPYTVVFLEETLSVEDLALKDGSGRSAYPELQRLIKSDPTLMYLPSVESATLALDRLAKGHSADRVHLTDDGLSADIQPGDKTFLFVSLEDARDDEDRFQMLARHDRFMSEMVRKLLQKHPSVLAVYTADYPSFELSSDEPGRSRRHLLEDPVEPSDYSFFNILNKTLLYYQSAKIRRDIHENGTELGQGTASLVRNDTDNMAIQIEYASLSTLYNLTLHNGYWTIENIELKQSGHEDAILYGSHLNTPTGFSYHCGQITNYTGTNDTDKYVALSFTKLQIEAFFKSTAEGKFNSAYDCVGVMSLPIWSAIILMAILVVITSGGIAMMMDIKTMDRFDDPKGKTITIASTE